ncbi:ATP-binding protein [Nocardioides albus]|uniref:DNA-binding SARP family transcriptional activator n=1 Tax=Nocardioides albus TaxID=1841 RepID=A0A7W5A262_9ACTN|nr:AAA family ATPase [Nocardioides albus]MBB3087989.1 DNA-binding SARP family transcriptional activator [Nocardioides albus]GGU21819.1 transcriptional activator [Nocardioides albus]
MDERHDPPAPLLRLHLLDGFRVTRDGGPPLPEKWPRPSARALVKLLAVTPDHRLHREQVMETCWPGIDAQAAIGSLRVALHAARHALEPELAPRAASSYLVADGPMLALDPATVRIDADRAEEAGLAALRANGEAADGGDDALARALALFTGDLLPEDRYEPWTEARRDQIAELRDRLRLRLADVRLAAGEPRDAVALAEQVLAGSPADEAAHRVVIEAALRQGLRRQAVAQYHRCRRAMDAELGVRPGPAIERLHREALTEAPARVPAAPGLPAPVLAATAAPLRGRETVLGRLAAPGRPPVVLLTGEAGVGKTRLAAEAAARAAASGAAVLWGVGREPEGGAPYGMLAEALDRWFAGCDAAERADVGAEYPELAALLPSLGQVPADGERTPEEERDGLFRAGALVLGALAAERPVLVVLDDLQAGDAGTFRLLGHLARHAADRGTDLGFLATYRAEELPEGDPRRKVIASLIRQGLCVTEWLDGLDEEACVAMVRDAVPPADRNEDTLRRAWRLSRGNPLFALELARGPGTGTTGDLQTPDGVGQAVGLRLDRLDLDTRRIVEAIAVVGGEVALTELLDVARHGLEPPVAGSSVADAVERAIAASLVEERQVVVSGQGEDGLAFRHPVVRLTCYERLSGVRRRQLHAAVAEAVLRRRPDAVDTLAVHFARADDPRAGEYLRRAAERAAALYANDAADRYYRDLVTRLDVDAARARLAHGHVLYRMGQFVRAAETLRIAIDELGRRGEESECVLGTALLAQTLLRLGEVAGAAEVLADRPLGAGVAAEAAADHALAWSILRRLQGRYDDGYDAALRALRAAEEVPGAARHGLVARAYVSQATNLGLAGRSAESRAAADRALAPAEAYGEPTLLVAVLSTLRENARRHGRLRRAVELGDRALELALRSGDPSSAAFERANLSEIRLLLGEGDAACELAEQAVAAAEWEETWCLPYALAALAAVRSEAGRHDDAAALLARAEDAVTTAGDLQARQVVRTALAEHHLATGEPEAALASIAETTDVPVLLARAQFAAENIEEAHRVAAAEVERACQAGEHLDEVDATVVLALASSRLGRGADAEVLLAAAEQLADDLPYPAARRRAAEARRALVSRG